MEVIDLLLLPVYIGLIYVLANYIRGKNSGNQIYQRYYMKGLNYKMFGSLGFASIYLFYYRGGDSINFHITMQPLYRLFFQNPGEFFYFLLTPTSTYPLSCTYEVLMKGVGYLCRGTASLSTIRLGGFINLFCFNSYLVCSVVFSFISYIFIFRAFALFSSLYPKLEKQFAIAFLMIPSVLFWGSGVSKDTIMLGSILLLITAYHELVIGKRNFGANIIWVIVSAYVISSIRGFILFSIVPGLLLMTAVYYRASFKSALLRVIIGPVFLGVGALMSYLFIQGIGNSVQSYNLDILAQKAEGFHSWHTYLGETQGGSSYSLGNDVDYTITGILRKAPIALVICLFGPFVWQIRNAVMLMAGIESIVFLFYFFKVFLNLRAYRALNILFRDHIVMFCIPVIIIIGIAIGMTSFNYGALVRYRIPIQPLLAVLLIVTNYRINNPEAA